MTEHSGIGSCDCGRRWEGLREAHCSACHETFTSDSGFDAHLANPKARESCHDPRYVTDTNGRRVFRRATLKSGEAWALKASAVLSDPQDDSEPSTPETGTSRRKSERVSEGAS